MILIYYKQIETLINIIYFKHKILIKLFFKSIYNPMGTSCNSNNQ